MRRPDFLLSSLAQVEELIIRKEPRLLDNFFDEVLQFQSDTNADVRKQLIAFVETAMFVACLRSATQGLQSCLQLNRHQYATTIG